MDGDFNVLCMVYEKQLLVNDFWFQVRRISYLECDVFIFIGTIPNPFKLDIVLY